MTHNSPAKARTKRGMPSRLFSLLCCSDPRGECGIVPVIVAIYSQIGVSKLKASRHMCLRCCFGRVFNAAVISGSMTCISGPIDFTTCHSFVQADTHFVGLDYGNITFLAKTRTNARLCGLLHLGDRPVWAMRMSASDRIVLQASSKWIFPIPALWRIAT